MVHDTAMVTTDDEHVALSIDAVVDTLRLTLRHLNFSD